MNRPITGESAIVSRTLVCPEAEHFILDSRFINGEPAKITEAQAWRWWSCENILDCIDDIMRSELEVESERVTAYQLLIDFGWINGSEGPPYLDNKMRISWVNCVGGEIDCVPEDLAELSCFGELFIPSLWGQGILDLIRQRVVKVTVRPISMGVWAGDVELIHNQRIGHTASGEQFTLLNRSGGRRCDYKIADKVQACC